MNYVNAKHSFINIRIKNCLLHEEDANDIRRALEALGYHNMEISFCRIEPDPAQATKGLSPIGEEEIEKFHPVGEVHVQGLAQRLHPAASSKPGTDVNSDVEPALKREKQ